MGLQQYALSFKRILSRAHHFHTAKFIIAPGLLLMGKHTVKFIMASYTHKSGHQSVINPLNAELNPICYLMALLGAHHFLHVSRIGVKSLTLRQLMSYIYGAPILDVSRSHTTTHHSR